MSNARSLSDSFPSPHHSVCRRAASWSLSTRSLSVYFVILLTSSLSLWSCKVPSSSSTSSLSSTSSSSSTPSSLASSERGLILWHALRGDEQRYLEQDLQLFESETGLRVTALQLPHNAFANKLQVAIPRGNGPDVFIGAHDRVGDWAEAELIEPLSFWIDRPHYDRYLPATVSAFTYRQQLYGLPLSCKALALFYNPKLVDSPSTVRELIERASAASERTKNLPNGQRVWGLAYSEIDSLYFHAPWLHAYGGRALQRGQPQLNSEAMRQSAGLIKGFRSRAIIPPEVDGALASELFRSGRLAYLINGPWFIAELGGLSEDQWSVTPLPLLEETGHPLQPYLSVEGVMVSARAAQPRLAWRLASYLSSPRIATQRVERGELIAHKSLTGALLTPWQAVFQEQISRAVPLSNEPQMKSIWTPIKRALGQAIIYEAPLPAAFEEAQKAVLRSLAEGEVKR